MIERIPGSGWLALLGGGEFSFEETEEADRAWLAKAGDGTVAFLPAASGSEDYGKHFAVYLDEYFERRVETVPIYRVRDARRERNLARLREAAAIYLGGGVADHLLAAVAKMPCESALRDKVTEGGTVVAIAAAAQALGAVARGLRGQVLPGLGWLPGVAVEANFHPTSGSAGDRRLRQLMAHDEVRCGLAIPAESAVLLGPSGQVEVVGEAFVLTKPDGELVVLENET